MNIFFMYDEVDHVFCDQFTNLSSHQNLFLGCITIKGCSHRAMILCTGAVDSHQKQSKPITQWEYLSFAIFAIFDLKNHLKLFGWLASNF